MLFWVLFILGFFFFGYGFYRNRDAWVGGPSLLIWILLFLLGWAEFGAAVHK